MSYLKYCFTGFAAWAMLIVTTIVFLVFIPYWISHPAQGEDVEQSILYATITFSIVWAVFFIGNFIAWKRYKSFPNS